MDSSDSDTSSNSETTISTSSASSSSILYGRLCTRSEMIIEKSTKALFYASYRHQEFSLPDSIMHYIAMNPKNAKLYEKLIQSCKFFFVKNPILVLSNLYYDSSRWIASNDGGWKFMTLGNVTSKFWITQRVSFNPVNAEDKSAASIIPKIYQCDATITPPSDGSAITFNTFTELLKNPQFLKLKGCTFWDTPEDFDLDTFYNYMKKNKHTSIRLHFCDTISEAYKTRLQTIVNEIVESETHEYKPPFIGFPGHDEKMCDKLRKLYDRHL
uniref:Uncharacterized protein n=1 Tax=Panagrolaimus sp. ES5 TaxID=591445 RepID=A0AC34FDL6_9BILA